MTRIDKRDHADVGAPNAETAAAAAKRRRVDVNALMRERLTQEPARWALFDMLLHGTYFVLTSKEAWMGFLRAQVSAGHKKAMLQGKEFNFDEAVQAKNARKANAILTAYFSGELPYENKGGGGGRYKLPELDTLETLRLWFAEACGCEGFDWRAYSVAWG